MTRVAYFGYPARSHTLPSLPVVRELIRRGAEVEYYSTERFRNVIEGAGARFAPYESIHDGLADPDGVAGPEGVTTHALRLARAAETTVPELMARAGSPDLVMFDASACWGGRFAREKGLPCSAVVTTFAFTRTMLQLLGVTDAEALRVLVADADLNIVCTSRYFQPSGRFFGDDKYVFVGPVLDERPAGEGVRIAVDGPRPLAYVSMGTIFNRDLRLLRNITEVLSAEGWQSAVALGDGAMEPGGWPPHVAVYPFVDQMAALALADLAVTHGGLTSVSEIAVHRLPAVVVPQAVDQFLVARRLESLGAAVVVDGKTADAQTWQPALVRVREQREEMAAAAGCIAESFTDVTPMGLAAERALSLRGAAA